ncbi:MAG: hypothetical protein A3F78_17265 [Burkholderiales bacterium RIFCSPLOWO2_12_FULL_61_40]|nr:MAG: hypothetical protein A3F78_17265 [Burkholderiales bacterium RIFCSPLOWO2_12_FULL_61_40]
MANTARRRFIVLTTASYAVLALAWIFLSDQLLAMFTDVDSMVWLSTAKGVFFVVATAGLFFFALHAVPPADAGGRETVLDSLALGTVHGGQPRWLTYAFTLVITIAMLYVRQSMAVDFGDRPMLILFMFPIILSALFGGVGPGLLATAVAALGVDYFWIPPRYSFRIAASHDVLQWAFLIVNGVAVSVLSGLLRRTLAKAEINRRLLDAVVSGTPDAVFVKDLQGRYQLHNKAVARLVGRPFNTIAGRDDYFLFPEAIARKIIDRDRLIMANGQTQTLEERVTTHDGKEVVFLVTKGPVLGEAGQITGLFGIARDITEREQAQAAIRSSESAMRLAQRLAGVGNWDWDLSTGVHTWSEEIYRIYGCDSALPPAVYPESRQFFTPQSWATMAQAVEKCLSDGGSYECDAEVVRPDGSHRWITARGQASHDAEGKVIRLHGTVQDITERKRTNEDLRFVLNEAGDAIWISDSQGLYTFANPSACKLTGHSLEELRSMHIPDLVHEQCHDELVLHLQRLQTEKFIRREWTLNHKDGRVVSVELTTERMQDGRYMAFGRDLTQEKLTAAALRERERQLVRVMDGSEQGYWEWNLVTNAFDVSARWENMLGYETGESHATVDSWPQLIHPDDFAVTMESIRRHVEGESQNIEVEVRCRTKAGSWRWILSRGRIVERSSDGKPLIMSGTHTDITEHKIFELAQREAATVFTSSYEGIMVVSPEQLITKVNPAFTRITGYSAEEAIGQSPKILSSGLHGAAFYAELWNSVHAHDFWRGEIWDRRKNGEVFAELLSISTVRDAGGVVQHYVGVFSDISQLKAHEAELDRIAHYDPLTGSPNRRLLADRLGQATLRATRNGTSLAVCYLDLDGFKAVNDQYGHPAGDQLLVGITGNLKQVLRAEDTLARLGGDEFVLLLADIASPEECSQILDRVLHAASSPILIEGMQVSVSASIGVCLFPEDDVDADTLLRHSDQAMYLAKEAGKNRYHLFDPESDRKAQKHRQQLDRLRTALEQQEFVLYYQPKVDLVSGEIVGVEALLRWQHPERGLIPPMEFLPHINGSDLEKPVGEWVIRTTLAQSVAWSALGLKVCVSANISANHLLQPDFFEHLRAALASYPHDIASRFELEILETAAIADIDQAVDVLCRCRALGVRFALDDFGTGYSSLTHLRKLPVDILKIDQSFVRAMLDDVEDLGIVEGVIRLAGAFNRQVIAEGVETLEHGGALLRMGCRLAQGYGIARPMPAAQFADWSTRWTHEAAWLTLGRD